MKPSNQTKMLSSRPAIYGETPYATSPSAVHEVLLKLESAYFEEAEKWDALLEFLGGIGIKKIKLANRKKLRKEGRKEKER